MRKRQIIKCTFLFITIFTFLTGCGMSVREETALHVFEATAEKYYEEKYGVETTLEKCSYVYTEPGLFFPERTEDMYAVCSDGTTILYLAETNQISDNKQSGRIIDDLENAFYARLDALLQNMVNGEFVVASLTFNEYTGNLDGNYFYTLYEGDIDTFIASEAISLDADLFLLCGSEDSWENTQAALNQMLTQDFATDSWVELTVLSRDCYNKYQAGDSRYPGTDMLECYAVYGLGSAPYSRIQHYVKLADGIYVTSYEKDFILEEGDLTLVEAISEEELNRIILTNYEALPDAAEENKNGSYMVHDKEHVNYYQIDADTPIYQIQFSQRIKELYGEEFSVYLRFVPEELGLSADKKMYYFPMDRPSNYWSAFAIYTDYADAEFATLRESDYFFAGTQVEIAD